MNDFSRYRPVGGIERLFAFSGNFILLSILGQLAFWLSERAGLNQLEMNILASVVYLAAILFFCLHPETPCKRLGHFKILNEQNKEIGTKERIVRMSPYLILAASLPVFALLPKSNDEITLISGLVVFPFLIVNLFIFCDGLTVFFHPHKLSLLDMKLGTRVVKPPPLPEHLKPKFFGRKII